MMEQRRLRGHCAAATCCIASRLRPGLVATAAEDGYVCWFDLRCKDVLFKMDVANGSPVSSLCFKQGNENIMYVSTGNEVKCFDLHMAASWKQLESYNYNKDEINQIVFHSKSSFLAAADDAGDVKIIDIQQRCLYKTLRAGHRSLPVLISRSCTKSVHLKSLSRFAAAFNFFPGGLGKSFLGVLIQNL